VRRTSVLNAAAGIGSILLWYVLPATLLAAVLASAIGDGSFAVDHHVNYWQAGRDVLAGDSPYLATEREIAEGDAFAYPAVAATLFAVIALAPQAVGDVLAVAVAVGAVVVALRAFDVRDPRVYGAVFLWPPVLVMVQTGNITSILVGGVAVVWSRRDHPAVAGALLGLLIAVKLLLWPLVVWLVATRRYRAAVISGATAAVLSAAAWSLIGWNELHAYRDLAGRILDVWEIEAYSVAALGLRAGIDAVTVNVGLAGVAVLACGACLISSRRLGDRGLYIAAVAIALLLSPVAWMHYFALLIAVVALIRKHLGWIWLVPVLMWAGPGQHPDGMQITIVVLVCAATCTAALVRAAPEAAPA
jgi:alpha-1,2-mannosyltransferase